MDRYRTRHYVCTDEAEAQRLARIDNSQPSEIRVTRNVEPLHVTSSWILWSDGKFSTGIGCDLPRGGSLSADAVDLISAVRGSDSGDVECGLLKLAEIVTIEKKTPVSVGAPRGHYHPKTIERLNVLWKDGSRSDLYTVSAGYFEGYQFDIYQSLEALLAAEEKMAKTMAQLESE